MNVSKTRQTSKLHGERLDARIVLDAGPLIISEFLAANNSGLKDEDGTESDWVEIRNVSDTTVDLHGWSLTDRADEPRKWTFPDRVLDRDSYLLVFASGKNRTNEGQMLHTNFKLSSGGEYLGLYQPSGSVASEFAPRFPPQYADSSYGFDQEGNPTYFATLTPGEENSTDTFLNASDIQFSNDSGFRDESFLLTLSTTTPNAKIRFTTDGSKPSSMHGMTYAEPIRIQGSTIVRALSIAPGFDDSNVQTRSYLYLDDVLSQTDQTAIDLGYPETWGTDPRFRPVMAHYGMDSKVAGPNDAYDGKYAATMRQDLLALPSLSLVVDQDHMFGPNGLYNHTILGRGMEFERPVSGELIDPESGSLVPFDAGIRIQGGIGRHVGLKQSFRLAFRKDYGLSQLKYPFFGEDAADTFDSITLRSSTGEMIAPGRRQFIRDAYVRQTQLATGHPSPHSRFVHLYLNGMYWGVYEPTERPDEQFAENYFGGEKAEWDVLVQNEAIAGNMDAWEQLVLMTQHMRNGSQANAELLYSEIQGLQRDGTHDPEKEALLNVTNYIDYLLVQWHSNTFDWPGNNYYMMRRRGLESKGFQFIVWDAEHSLSQTPGLQWNREEIDEKFIAARTSKGPRAIFAGLYAAEGFRVKFADRAEKLLAPGGPLYVDPENPKLDGSRPDRNHPADRFLKLVETYNLAIVPESARWGVMRNFLTSAASPRMTRDEEWRPKVEAHLNTFFPDRSAVLVEDLTLLDLYRDAPRFDEVNNVVAANRQIHLDAKGTTIYFTIDGTDPRLPDGTISPSASVYSDSITMDQSQQIRARSLSPAGKWSAIGEQTYLVDQQASATSLRVSEVYYHPAAPTIEEVALGHRRRSDFEYIELVNTSSSSIDLRTARLTNTESAGRTEGVRFDFSTGWITELGPHERVLVVEDTDAFRTRFGRDLPIAGQWQGRLDNGREWITLEVDGLIVQQFRYQDSWYPESDGGGFSLVIEDRFANDLNRWNQKDGWRASELRGGTPGRIPHVSGDSNRDGIFNSADLVQVFRFAEYDDLIAGNSTWEEGDWNGDGDFDSGDLVDAFIAGHYRFD